MREPVTTSRFTTPDGAPVQMGVRPGTNDWNVCNACLTEDEYRLKDLDLSGYALDIGAHIGAVAIGLALDHPDLTVLAVEPVPENCELMRQNIEANGLVERVHVGEWAVGKDGETEIAYGYHGNEQAEIHTWIGNQPMSEDTTGTVITVPSRDLATVLGIIGRKRIALAKIDCEGCEYDFLNSALVGAIERIHGEYHRGREGIREALEETHRIGWSGPEEGPGLFVAVRR